MSVYDMFAEVPDMIFMYLLGLFVLILEFILLKLKINRYRELEREFIVKNEFN